MELSEEEWNEALKEAAQNGDMERLKRLLEQEPKRRKISEMWWYEAVQTGDTERLVDQLNRGADVNATYYTTTALYMAIGNDHVEVVKVLLDHGASVTPENTGGFTALTLALVKSRDWGDYWPNPDPDPRPLQMLLEAGAKFGIREAVLLNDVELARARLDEGADVNTGRDDYHGPVLMLAAELGYLDMVDLLVGRGADLEATDDLAATALPSAAAYGRTEVVLRLIERGADINAGDGCGVSTLAHAAIDGNRDLHRLLLSRGAKRSLIEAVALDDETLVNEILDREGYENLRYNFVRRGKTDRVGMLAVNRGNANIVRLLLDRGMAHLDEHWDGHSLLAEAARCGHVDVAQLLIDRGADLHAVGRDGLTPLEWAIKEGQDAVVTLLKRAGAAR